MPPVQYSKQALHADAWIQTSAGITGIGIIMKCRAPLLKAYRFSSRCSISAFILVNPLSKMGMSSSIRRDLGEIKPRCRGILIALGDQRLLRTRTINVLIRTFNEGKGGITRRI